MIRAPEHLKVKGSNPFCGDYLYSLFRSSSEVRALSYLEVDGLNPSPRISAEVIVNYQNHQHTSAGGCKCKSCPWLTYAPMVKWHHVDPNEVKVIGSIPIQGICMGSSMVEQLC